MLFISCFVRHTDGGQIDLNTFTILPFGMSPVCTLKHHAKHYVSWTEHHRWNFVRMKGYWKAKIGLPLRAAAVSLARLQALMPVIIRMFCEECKVYIQQYRGHTWQPKALPARHALHVSGGQLSWFSTLGQTGT